ncbi:MAG: response regulator [Deltaproteobacteria bacterium]
MSHELRTPLNAVCGIAEILDAYVPDGEGRGLLSDLSAAARHLTSLIGDVLDFSKIESGKLVIEDKDFDLMRIFRELEGSFAAQARIKGISFTLVLDPSIPRVLRGDPLRVKQILYNLVGNAFKFVNEGLVTVTVRYGVDESGESPRMVISVADTGPGIPEDQIEAVFSPFEQTEHGRKAGGTGLGLSISRELARLMGGDITLKSRCGHGTTFTVTLALPEGDPSGITGEECPSTVVSGGRALVVDDVPLNRKVLRLFLQKDGWTVVEAGSGEEVLSILAMDAGFDMIFMDISMPGMDGMEVTRRIRQLPNHVRIPVVAVTAHALAGDQERFLAAGMDGYVVKPIRLKHVRNEIARLLSAPAAASTRLAGAGPSPVSRDDSSQPLDLVALVATCQGNEELARELIEDLLRELKGWVREVDDRLQAGDLGGVRKICHLIRGTASTVAAERLAQAAGDLGGMIREERLGEIPEGHLRLGAAVRELRDWWAALSFSEPSRWSGPGMTSKRVQNYTDTPAPSP